MNVGLVEVGPRDGLQNERALLSTEAKVTLITRLVAAGVRRVEVASFVNPTRVPQMADAEAVLSALPTVPEVSYIGLVLNRKGFDRAVTAGCREVGMVVAASDSFNRRNQGKCTDDSIADWLNIAGAARAVSIRTHVTIAVAFGCPFEGEIDPVRVVDIAKKCAEAEPVEIAIADTIGVGVPTQVSELLRRLRDVLPGVRLRCHFHNTRNTGMANAYAAVSAGADTLDASVGGVGGCPFAPGATGNIATEDLVYMLDRMGIKSGVSMEGVIDTSRWLEAQIGRPVPSMLSKAGRFPRS